ncbi:endonuclease [Filibacter tadaridae]|uniref:Extracellular ribonuclease n=1 Tax=Filibacter tadaridae TaxID=2483811 RepID=A0A3P5X926_9BACL|nr:endonuclease [Filibacter tadaridae]VDC23914.1 Extracellular ribonuclease precursor [Filibacter tadaridae]
MSKGKKPINTLLSVGLVASLVVPALPTTVTAATNAADLIISEYIEGSSLNKAIELYNGTGSSIELSQYSLELYRNGATTVDKKLTLSGTLADGETYVIYHNEANDDIKGKGDLANKTLIDFNGDDPVVLKKAGTIIDSIGQVGIKKDFAEDVTLVRKSTITSGDTDITDAFDSKDEWNLLPKDDSSNLGTHTMDGSSPGEPETPAETVTIAEARETTLGEKVTIKGVVTATLNNSISIQDATGGIAVRPTSLDVKVGDEVTLSGTLADYRGLLQLDSATIVKKSSNVGAPTPKEITGAGVSEENESQLVVAKKLKIISLQEGSTNYTATDGTTEFLIRDENDSLGLEVGYKYDSVTGIIQQFDDDYQIIPRSVEDIVVDGSILQPVSANPGSGTFIGGTTVTLTTGTADAEILYTLDGTDPTENGTVYATPLEITKDTTLKAVVKTKDGSVSVVKTYDYTITDSLEIHDIQGEGHSSSFEGQTVEGIEGIVTYTFTLSGSTYYHIQTPDSLKDDNLNTSEGILLYSGKKDWPIQVGDLVAVTGKVSEYAIDGYDDRQLTDMKTTQINVRDDQGGNVVVLKENVELPKPISIDEDNLTAEYIDSDNLNVFNPKKDAIDFWESLEGMRVQVGNTKAVSPQEHGDLVTVLEDAPTNTLQGGLLLEEDNQNANRIQFRLEPNGPARDFEVATGDKFEGPITGVVGYSFQNYKIYTSLDDMKAAHSKGEAKPEKTTIVKDEDKLTIASYNLENFSNNKKSTTDDKAQKLARAFANDMNNPDIIGVTEVQDNNGQDEGESAANESYERLIAEIVKAGGVKYEYANIDPVNNQDGGAPNANIRVGFLYNPDRVSLTEGIEHGNATKAVGYKDDKLTLNPGRIDPENIAFESSRKPLAAQFDFQGESVIVIANHWNSKNGDTPLFGSKQPPVNGSEAQRKEIAKIVYNFVDDIKDENPYANVVSLGDFNDFQFSDAIKIHEGELMTDMINKVEIPDRYTYVFQGNSQVLDHVIVSNNLVNQTEIDILHINADFTDMAGRASDHDPVLVQVDLTNEDVVAPMEAEKTYNLTNMKTKKLTINKPSVSITLDDASDITEGILFTGSYAEFLGTGFAKTKVTIKPTEDGAIVDFKGAEAMKVIIDGSNVKEVRGAENIKNIEFVNGAKAEDIKFYNSKGEPIGVPPFSKENKTPVVSKEITNKTVKAGETLSILLTDHFTDPDGDELTFTATKGTVNEDTATLAITLEEGSHVVGVTASDGEKRVTTQFSVTVTSGEVPTNEYYKDAIGKEGQELKNALHSIISEQTVLSYSQVWEALRETDEDPNNVNNVTLLYSGESRSKNRNGGAVGDWNREHVWAKSHGDFGTSKGPGTDIHHLRPTDVQVNSSRGNLDFDNGGSSVKGCDDCKRSSDSWEPPNRVKGDVARMLFYMATRYEKGDRVDLELNEKLNNGKNPYHGKLSVLLEWHKQDPVDEIEQKRNDMIQKWQHNRNPFIDHPEWVKLIWGQTNFSSFEIAS